MAIIDKLSIGLQTHQDDFDSFQMPQIPANYLSYPDICASDVSGSG
jgi:hypothetical protein